MGNYYKLSVTIVLLILPHTARMQAISILDVIVNKAGMAQLHRCFEFQ